LERAIELDSELSAPYGILWYVYIRQNKLEKAIDARVKSVHHNPFFERVLSVNDAEAVSLEIVEAARDSHLIGQA
jgi:hypothetical protein